MNYKNFLINNYDTVSSPEGDLARDCKMDDNFPIKGRKSDYRKYLEQHNACSACLDAFESTYMKFAESRKKNNG